MSAQRLGRHVQRHGLGVDQLRLQKTSSGELIRFSYRVVDAKKAQVLHDKKASRI